VNISILRDVRRARFWRTFGTHAFSCVGVISFLFGLYDVIDPNAISKLDLPLPACIIAVSLVYAVVRSYPRPVEAVYSKPNTMIRVVEGDLFDQPHNLVVGMTTTFDTQIPHIINAGSVQGQFLARVYANDIAALDHDIDQELAKIPAAGHTSKPGKTECYPVGTVLSIRHSRKHYFCVAYGEMDGSNQAQASMDGIWRSLENLWREVRAKANGDPVAIPVVAGGLARLSQILPAQDSIRFIAMSFMFASRHTQVCDRLDIVVRPDDLERLDMLELQAFLNSLKEI
jgi:antiphage defense system Thoeris ThsA-like protein